MVRVRPNRDPQVVEPLPESHLRASGHAPGDLVRDLELPLGYEARFIPLDSIAPGRSREATSSATRVPSAGTSWRRRLRRGRVVILKSDQRDKLLRAGIHDPDRIAAGPLVADWIEGGRTRHALIETEGESWVLKAYRRGGAVGTLNSARYWGVRRFLRELEVASTAQRMGVATAEVLALILEPAGFGSVRAWLVSRYLPGVRPLYEFFGDRREVSIFSAAGSLVERMHRAGIDHPDLHLGNIVGTLEGGAPRVFIIDWDRARCHRGDSWKPYGNLVRLWRWVEKGRRRVPVRSDRLRRGASRHVMRNAPSVRSFKAFVRGYFKGRPADLRQARDYFRRRALLFELRTLFWRSER